MSAIFPGAVATPLQLLTAINNTKVTLNADAGIGDTTMTVDDASPLPASGYLTFDDHETNPETVYYTGISGADLTGVTRGADGTSAGTHITGAHLEQRFNADYHNIVTTELIAVEQYLSDRFGKGSSPVIPSGKTLTIAATSNQLVVGTTNTTTVSFTAPSASRTYTVPDAGGAASFVMSAGTQTIAGAKTFSTQVIINPTTNQIVLGVTNTTTISATAPASSAVYTIPDVGTTASFVMTAGTQTIAGTKTFSSAPVISALTASTVPYLDSGKVLASSAVTPTELGYVSGVTSALQTQINALGVSQPMNILDNGGFEIWQRGTSFTNPADSTYLCDRFYNRNSESAGVAVTKETSIVDGGLTSMKIVVTTAGASTYWKLIHVIEDFAAYRGKTITLSVRVRSNTASAVRVSLNDGVNAQGYSSYHSGGSTFETLTVTYAVSSTSSILYISLGMIDSGDKKTGTYYFDSAMLAVSASAVAFVPTNPEVDMARCQRFYYRIGGQSAGDWTVLGQCISTTHARFPFRFPVPMRAVPTITIVGATGFTLANASASSIATTAGTSFDPNINSVLLDLTVASGLVAGNATYLQASPTAYYEASADL